MQMTGKHACHSHKWSVRAHARPLLMQVRMYAATSMAQFQMARGPVVGLSPKVGDPCCRVNLIHPFMFQELMQKFYTASEPSQSPVAL